MKVVKSKVKGQQVRFTQRFSERPNNTQQERRESMGSLRENVSNNRIQSWKAFRDHFPKHGLQVLTDVVSENKFGKCQI